MGRSTTAVIRPCFLPTIRIALDHMATVYNTHDTLFCSDSGLIEQ